MTWEDDDLPPLTGSPLLDPWRIRLRLERRGALQAPPPRRPTASEVRLWEALDALEVGWCREYATGPYRLDFYLRSSALAVEVDGPSHWGRKAAERDQLRDQWHQLRGIRTLRVSDREVLDDLEAVLFLISRELEVRSLAADTGVPSALGNEVAMLAEAAATVAAEIVRLAAACETVLPSFGPRRYLRPFTSASS
jgi:very-short-patch-repair endonuclease